MEAEKLSYLATSVCIGVLAGMWILKDQIMAVVALPSTTREWLRLGVLRLRGQQDYEGRHRAMA